MECLKRLKESKKSKRPKRPKRCKFLQAIRPSENDAVIAGKLGLYRPVKQ
jgi:hypothetical protein